LQGLPFGAANNIVHQAGRWPGVPKITQQAALMTAQGQTQKSERPAGKSALPLRTDIPANGRLAP